MLSLYSLLQKRIKFSTILSRCQIFDFKRVSIKDICNHLSFVSKKEGVNAEEAFMISQKSDGSIRDALSLFDRLASFPKELTYKSTITNLNILTKIVILKSLHLYYLMILLHYLINLI